MKLLLLLSFSHVDGGGDEFFVGYHLSFLFVMTRRRA